jgi:uncharacterized phage protein gp47/JayE
MIQKPKTKIQYQSELLSSLTSTGIRMTSPGSKARAFMDIIGDKLGDSEARNYTSIGQALLPYMTGDSLDFFGDIIGLARIARVDVNSSSLDTNFKFFVTRGTFGNINNGQDITLPAGTRIFTASDSGPICVLATQVTLPAASNQISVSVTSLNPGVSGNASPGIFTRHNFTNYSDSRFGTLLVTNNFGLVGGRDEEDDESYRFRINLKLQSRGGAAEADIRLAVLGVPGIQDVVFEPLAGTFNVYVYGISPVVPPSLLQLVQAAVDDKTAYPLRGTAITPDLVGISLNTRASFVPTASDSDKQVAISAAVAAAQDYLNNLGVGQPVVINEIADRIQSADSRILDIGDPNKPLDDIFIWRSRLDATRYSRFLVANYTPQLGERIVVESIASAINIVSA